MAKRILVLDTSYLVELYRVPGKFAAAHAEEIKSRIDRAIRERASIFVPLVCLFELAKHIDLCDSKPEKARLAERLTTDIRTSFDNQGTWIILLGAHEKRAVLMDFENWSARGSIETIQFADSVIVAEAAKLKQENPRALVHILTKDKKLKAREPDPETDAFLGAFN